MINLKHFLEQNPGIEKIEDLEKLRTIHVRYRTCYGRMLVYPECDTAKLLANLLEVKTFNDAQISNIEKLGYIIQKHL